MSMSFPQPHNHLISDLLAWLCVLTLHTCHQANVLCAYEHATSSKHCCVYQLYFISGMSAEGNDHLACCLLSMHNTWL